MVFDGITKLRKAFTINSKDYKLILKLADSFLQLKEGKRALYYEAIQLYSHLLNKIQKEGKNAEDFDEE